MAAAGEWRRARARGEALTEGREPAEGKVSKEVPVLKVVILGGDSTGKSNLFRRFCKGRYDDNSPSTIGVEYGVAGLDIQAKRIRFAFWDTVSASAPGLPLSRLLSGGHAGWAGKYDALTISYLRGARCIVIVFDITR
jgi:GTPase SAR1 family protein